MSTTCVLELISEKLHLKCTSQNPVVSYKLHLKCTSQKSGCKL